MRVQQVQLCLQQLQLVVKSDSTNQSNRNTIKQNLSVFTGSVGGVQQSVRNVSRERWGDIYCNMPVKRMIALYDYDPQELSPNVDAEVCHIYIVYEYDFSIIILYPFKFFKISRMALTNLSH